MSPKSNFVGKSCFYNFVAVILLFIKPDLYAKYREGVLKFVLPCDIHLNVHNNCTCLLLINEVMLYGKV